MQTELVTLDTLTTEWAQLDPRTIGGNEWSQEQYGRIDGERAILLQVATEGAWQIVRTAVDPEAATLGIQERVPAGEIMVRRCVKPVADKGWWNCAIEILRGAAARSAIADAGIERRPVAADDGR